MNITPKVSEDLGTARGLIPTGTSLEDLPTVNGKSVTAAGLYVFGNDPVLVSFVDSMGNMHFQKPLAPGPFPIAVKAATGDPTLVYYVI